MQLEFLCNLKLPSLVKQRLGVLPPNLQEIYEENYSQKLESYQEEERRVVQNMFRFLLCAREELHTGGLLQALSVLDPENPSLSPDVLLDLCFNFIDIDYQLDVFRFAHLSVREYLEARDDYERTINHALAAQCCVRLLSSAEVVERYEFVSHVFAAWYTRVREDFPSWYFSDSEDLSTLEMEKASMTAFESNVKDLVRPKLITPIEHTRPLTEFHKYACFHWAFHLADSGHFRLACPLKDLSYAFMMDHQHATSKAYSVWREDASHQYYSLDPRDWKSLEELRGALGIDVLVQSFDPYNVSGPWVAARGTAWGTLGDSFPVDCPVVADYLFAACVWGFGDLLDIRIRAGLNFTNGQVGHYSGRALFTATEFGNYTAVRLLLEQGADVEWRDINGRTALCQSVIVRSMQTCKALLEGGADPGISDYQGNGPLCWAAYNSDLEMMKLLLKYESSINVIDIRFSGRPLVCAVTYGGLEVVQMLLNNGADPNIYDDWYDSALHWAAMKRDLGTMRILFNYGARAPTKLKRSRVNRLPTTRMQDPVTKLLQEHGCTFEDEDEFEPKEKDQVPASILGGLATITGGYGTNYLGTAEHMPIQRYEAGR